MVSNPSQTNPLSSMKRNEPRRFWRWLVGPHPSITELEARRKAQLLASMSLILIASLTTGTLSGWNAGQEAVNYLMLGLTFSILLVYVLSRTPQYSVGSIILCIGCEVAGFLLVLLNPETPALTLLIIIPLAYVIGNILLPISQMTFLILSSVAGMAILPVLNPSIALRQMVIAAGSLSVIGLLFLVAIRFRGGIERQQLEEIKTANRELSELAETLEQRVAERTRELELAAEVGRKISLVRDPEILLSEAVELIRQRFNLYYTQVYLVDSNYRNLVLKAGTGEGGQALLRRGHRLPIDLSSINGVAASERRVVVIEDVSTKHLHKYNPLLPDTRCEATIPLLVGDRVVGTLDMQSDRPGLLTMDNLSAFEALAGQLAVAIENASLFAETGRTRKELENKARRLTQEGWQNFLDAVDHSEHVIYHYDPQQNVTASTEAIPSVTECPTLMTPITVAGVDLGRFFFEGEDAWTEEESTLVNAVAGQVAQQLENIRLINQAETFQAEAEKAIRRMTHQGWDAYLGTIGTGHTSYIYNQNEVTTWKPGSSGNLKTKVRTSLKVHGETIGQLAVTGVEQLDERSAEMVLAISEQLSAHLENLRLYASAQQELAERRRAEETLLKFREALTKRATELETVARLSATVTALSDPLQVMQTVVDLAKNSFNLYHAHIYELDEQRHKLVLTAGSGEVGRQMATEGWEIPLDLEQSLVARTARTREALLINDVRSSPDFLTNPLLPETRAEMTIPIIVGDKVLGVLDVQSDKTDYFTQEDMNIQVTLAAQVGIAIENARLFKQVQRQAEYEATINSISQKIQSTTTVESALQVAIRELGQALGAQHTTIHLNGGKNNHPLQKYTDVGESSNGKKPTIPS